jgi:hypothetical protein
MFKMFRMAKLTTVGMALLASSACLAAIEQPVKPFQDEYKAILALVVAIAGGYILFLIKTNRQRRAVRLALTSEINALLVEASVYKRYLSDDGHDWLKAGLTLTESPVFVVSNWRMFNASLPYFWLLPNNELQKVLEFYSQIESCEKLIEILFGRVQEYVEAKIPLTEKQVSQTKIRVKRITDDLESALKITNNRIGALNFQEATRVSFLT